MSVAPVSRARIRPTARERERVADKLREACVDERLSFDTFLRRLEVTYRARDRRELAPLLADLRGQGWLARKVAQMAEATTAWKQTFADARRATAPIPLVLPTANVTVLGRWRGCDCVLTDPSVSRRHASITHDSGRWLLSDCGSLNGTFVNGARIFDGVELHPGDVLILGESRFVISALRRSTGAR